MLGRVKSTVDTVMLEEIRAGEDSSRDLSWPIKMRPYYKGQCVTVKIDVIFVSCSISRTG